MLFTHCGASFGVVGDVVGVVGAKLIELQFVQAQPRAVRRVGRSVCFGLGASWRSQAG